MYCLCILYLLLNQRARKNFVVIPKIACRTLMAKKISKKNFTEIFQNFFWIFFLKTWLAEICKADPRVIEMQISFAISFIMNFFSHVSSFIKKNFVLHIISEWPVSCERDSFAKGKKSLLQRRKTALLGWRVNKTFPWRDENSRSRDTGHWQLQC
jgi:hypothetical protein